MTPCSTRPSSAPTTRDCGVSLRLAARSDCPEGSTLADWGAAGATGQRWCASLDGVASNLALFADGVPVGMLSAIAPDTEGQGELISCAGSY